MPTPDPIAVLNPLIANPGPAPSGATDAAPAGLAGFADVLTALLTPAMPHTAVATPATVVSTSVESPRPMKLRAGAKEPTLPVQAAQQPQDQPVQLPPIALPPVTSPLPADPPAPPDNVGDSVAPAKPGLAGAEPDVPRPDVTPVHLPATQGNAMQATSDKAPQTFPDTPPMSPSSSPVPHPAIALPDTVPVRAPEPATPRPAETDASPTDQLAPVLVSVVNNPDGARHLTLHLRPDALGDLHIQIDRPPDAPPQIRIEAERPETLTLLVHNTTQLQRSLDQAGIGHDAVTVTFHAAPAVTPVSEPREVGQTSTQFPGTGGSQQGFSEGRARPAPPMQTAADGDPAATDPTPKVGTVRGSVRSGIDITA